MNMLLILHRKILVDLDPVFSFSKKTKQNKTKKLVLNTCSTSSY